MNTYYPDKLPPQHDGQAHTMTVNSKDDELAMGTWYSPEALRAYAAAAVADLQAQVKQLQDTLALQKRSYEREIELDVAAERERCAKLCFAKMPKPAAKWSDVEMTEALRQVAAAIRAGDTAP